MPPLDPTRAHRITASIVPRLMAGDAMTLQNLFLRAIGDPRYQPDPFEGSWAAEYGMAIEPIALDWHQRKTGQPLTDRGVQYFHPAKDYVSATLDARNAVTNCVVDVKCVNAFRDLDECLGYYAPQLIVQKECARATDAALLVVQGGGEPIEIPLYADPPYIESVWATVDRFWHCVETLTPPVPLYFPRVIAPEKWSKLDLDDGGPQPNWADEMRSLLTAWDTTDPVAKSHEATKIAIKKLFPDDCGKLLCAQFSVSRARNGAVSIRRR